MPSARIHFITRASVESRSPAAKRCCSSCNDSMGRLQHRTRPSGFGFEDLKIRDIGVPLDQGWNWTEAVERRAIQAPNLVRDVSAVSVDTDFVPIHVR